MKVSQRRYAWTSRCLRAVLIGVMCLSGFGCGSEVPVPQNQKKVVPVSGQVTVDGVAVPRVRVKLHPKQGHDRTNPTSSTGITDEQGRFAVTTYYAGDGAPPGEYAVTFTYIKDSSLKSSDAFGGKYASPQSSSWELTVDEDDESVDAGSYELVTE